MVPFQQLRLSAMVERLLKLAVCFLNLFALGMYQIRIFKIYPEPDSMMAALLLCTADDVYETV